MTTERIRRRVEAFNYGLREVPVRQDADIVRRAMTTGFDYTGQGIGTALKYPAHYAGGFGLQGSRMGVRGFVGRHAVTSEQHVCRRRRDLVCAIPQACAISN